MTIVWPPKDPNETVAYTADWTDQLEDDSIASWTMAVSSGDATISTGTQADNTIQFLVSAGTTATTTVFLHRITTSGGQILERTYSVYVADGQDSYATTSLSKRDLVGKMFEQCALSGWEYDITAEELDRALIRLDMLMWELKGRGYDLRYNFPTGIGAGSLSEDLGCPDEAVYALSIIGAQRLAPTMGKTLSQESKTAASEAMKALVAIAGSIPSATYAVGTPLGSGNRPWSLRYPYAV